MSLRRADDSVLSENTPSTDFRRKGKVYGLHRVILTAVRYVDDSKNMLGKTKTPEVVYDGLVIGGQTEGMQVSNIRDALGATGENYNYGERIYKVCTKPLTGTGAVPLNKQDGAVVYVAFIDGNPTFPLIVGGGKSMLDESSTGAKKADGPRRRWQFNGLYFNIDKNGVLTIQRKGGKFKEKEGFYEPAKEGDEIFLEWSEKKIKFNVGKDAIQEVRDGKEELVTLTFKSGLTLTIDGKNDMVKILTKAGAHITVDGKSDLIHLKDKGSGALKITGNKVALGASSAELLEQISQQLDKILTWAKDVGAIHDHIGNLGYPTAPPTQAPQYVTLSNDLLAIKNKVDGIKGTL